MNPDIFIDDFDITENTEELHAILGRSIIIATRFDNMCNQTAKFLQIKASGAVVLPEDEFNDFVTSLFAKFSPLNSNINQLPIEQSAKDILHEARKARNDVTHSLTIGMTGCQDQKVDEQHFTSHITSLVTQIAAGDYLISQILTILNKAPLPNYSEGMYTQKVVEWALGK